MIYKVLVGNEHGGAAASSAVIIKKYLGNNNFGVVFLSNGAFAQKFNEFESVFILNSNEPPIISSDSFLRKIGNYIRFVGWVLMSVFKFSLFVKKNKVKYIHTTNNHALLITILTKLCFKGVYIVSHWRCLGLASASNYISLLRKIDRVVCISNAVMDSLPDFLKVKSTVIYNGLDIKTIAKEGEDKKGVLRNAMCFSDDDFVIGTIGTFSSIKCHDLLIDSVPYLLSRNIKVVLFGSCPNDASEGHLAYLKNKVLAMGIGDQVFFLLDTDFPEPRRFIVDFDLFVGATWNSGLGEGFGLIYIEAMSQRLPVIAINVGAAGEIIVDNETGILIKNNDSEELARSINHAFQEKDMLQDYGKRGYSRAIKDFDISLEFNKLDNLYKQIIEC